MDGHCILLDRADAHFDSRRREQQAFADRNGSGEHGADHDRVALWDRECAVDDETKAAAVGVPAPVTLRRRGQCRAERIDVLARPGRHGKRRNAGEPRRREQRLHVGAHLQDALHADTIALHDHGKPAAHLQQVDDVQMLDRLRHHAVVGRDDEDHEVDARRRPACCARNVRDPVHRQSRSSRRGFRRRRMGSSKRIPDRSKCRAAFPRTADRCRRRSAP